MQDCLLDIKSKKLWFLDSGCSRHMTGDKRKFLSLDERKDGGSIAFRDNRKTLIKTLKRGWEEIWICDS